LYKALFTKELVAQNNNYLDLSID